AATRWYAPPTRGRIWISSSIRWRLCCGGRWSGERRGAGGCAAHQPGPVLVPGGDEAGPRGLSGRGERADHSGAAGPPAVGDSGIAWAGPVHAEECAEVHAFLCADRVTVGG